MLGCRFFIVLMGLYNWYKIATCKEAEDWGIQTLRNIFRGYDENKNGVIDVAELRESAKLG